MHNRCLYLVIFLCIVLAGCGKTQQATTRFSGTAMTIDYSIIVGQTLTEEQQLLVQQIILDTFDEIDLTYNKWNPLSEISRLNELPAKQKTKISQTLESFLRQTQNIVEITGKRFDPTIEPLQQLWKDRLAKGTTPTEAEIQSIMPAIGWDKIHFENGTFYKDNSLTQIDLGGIAKGLCVDLISEKLNQAGFVHVFVEWGGEIRANGHHPDKRPWNIFISNLGDTDPDHAVDYVSLNDEAIATSGDYLQNWTVKVKDSSVTYFHIIDPETGKPLTSSPGRIASASILAPTCSLADGLATAAMMFPTTEASQEWLESVKKEYPTIRYWIVKRDDVL